MSKSKRKTMLIGYEAPKGVNDQCVWETLSEADKSHPLAYKKIINKV